MFILKYHYRGVKGKVLPVLN